MRNEAKWLIWAAMVTLASTAYGSTGKIFEYNDPVAGNWPPECDVRVSYGTGGPGFLYTEYTVSCPGHHVVVGKYLDTFNNSCDFTTSGSEYSTSYNNCGNWRVYYTN